MASSSTSPRGIPLDTEQLSVLVVDDEPLHRDLVRAAVAQHEGVRVVAEAHNGRRGVELAAQLQPDVVVLDLRMPIMDGLTALPLIRRASPFSRIVVWSGHGPLEQEAVMEAGACACVRKVVPVEQLVAAIRARG